MAPAPQTPQDDELERMIPRYAGFRDRTAAALADLALLIIIETFLFVPIGWDWMAAPPEEKAWILPLGVAVGVPMLYDVGFTVSRSGATWGKRATRIYVCDLAGRPAAVWRAAVRHLFKYLSAATLGVGVLIQPFTYRKQALHDYLSGTVVRER